MRLSLHHTLIVSMILGLALQHAFGAEITSSYSGATGGNWSLDTNWTPTGVPANSGGDTYNVGLPDSKTINFDLTSATEITDLTLGGLNTVLNLNSSVNNLTVLDDLKGYGGKINVTGGTFSAPASKSYDVLSPNFSASSGAVINWAATTFKADYHDLYENRTILSADGAGSNINLSAVTNFNGAAWSQNWGPFSYTVQAINNGVVDLSGTNTIIGSSTTNGYGDDWLRFLMQTNGNINLNSLETVTGRTWFDVQLSSYSLPALKSATTTQFTLASGASINLPMLETLTDSIVTLTSSSNAFNTTTGKLTNLDYSRIAVSNGASVSFPSVTSFRADYQDLRADRTILSADGAGSNINLSAVTNFNGAAWSQNWGPFSYTVQAINNGVVDLSGTNTIIGSSTTNGYGDDWLRFLMQTNGNINLNSLETVTGRTWFDVQLSSYSLPALKSATTTQFTLASGASINLPMLETLTDSIVTLTSSSNAFNTTTGKLTNLDYSRIAVSNGASVSFPSVTSFRADYQDLRADRTILSADGAGSNINLSAVTNFNGAAWSQNWGPFSYTVQAINNGVVDLSGTNTIIGSSTTNGYGDDWLRFLMQTNGNINLNSLETVTGRTWFDVQLSSYSLPALKSATTTQFTLASGASINLPMLETLTDSIVTLTSSSNAFNTTTGKLTNLDYSRIAVSNGASVSFPSVTSFRADYQDLRADRTILSADGAGSNINLSAVTNFNGAAWSQNWGPFSYTVQAINNGVVDLSGTNTIIGSSTTNGYGDDWLRFFAQNGGRINLGSANFSNRIRFEANGGGIILLGNLNSGNYNIEFTANGTNSELSFAGNLILKNSTSGTISTGKVAITDSAKITVQKDVWHNLTDETAWNTSTGILEMKGHGIQFLELAGTDLGAVDPGNNGNFGFGQMIIGQSGYPAVLQVRDDVSNGNRGMGGEAESLYLFGINSADGLDILGGSTFVIQNYNIYTKQAGSWISLQSLFGPGQDVIPYSGGFISKNYSMIPGGWAVDSDGDWTDGANWLVYTPNGAGALASFGSKITAPRTVNVDSIVTVGSIVFDNANTYTISGPWAISLVNNGNRATIAVNNSNGNGSHEIASRLNVFENLDLINNSTGTLTLSGLVSNPYGKEITQSGIGPIVITQPLNSVAPLFLNQGSLQLLGSDSTLDEISFFYGGPLSASDGSDGGDLIVGDITHVSNLTATSINVNSLTIGPGSTVTIKPLAGGPLSAYSSPKSVPEPATWLLLLFASLTAAMYYRSRK